MGLRNALASAVSQPVWYKRPCQDVEAFELLLLPGVLFGDRVVKYHDTITFTDKKNGLRWGGCAVKLTGAAPLQA
jgi:hypothetical protein